MNCFDNETDGRQGLDGDEIIFTLDLAGNFNFINRAGERLIGYTAEEARHLNVLDILPGKSIADIRALARRSIRQRFGTVFEIEITNRYSARVRLEASIDSHRRSDGALEFHALAIAPRANLHTPRLDQRGPDENFGLHSSSETPASALDNRIVLSV